MRLGLLIVAVFAAAACSNMRMRENVRGGGVLPGLSLTEDIRPEELSVESRPADTVMVSDAQGRQMLLMKAVRDEDGEMVANDEIVPSVVVASFRNVAERGGKVDLRFDITLPPEMAESRWQVRLTPVLYALGDSLALAPVFFTGERYRKAQLRGYQRYRRFLDSIVRDSSLFVRVADLEIFLKRNFAEVYAFRNDSTFVTEEQFESAFGVTGREAVEHYTDHFRKRLNSRRARQDKDRFRRYVKVPLDTEGTRLDTVVRYGGEAYSYTYVHTMPVPSGLRKVEIELRGSVYDEDRLVCELPVPGRLTYYVSSLSSLADETPRYLTRIVERRVEASSLCWLEFAAGSWALDLELGNNGREMERIERNVEEVVGKDEFELDSVIVTSSCSPEGSFRSNSVLAGRRSEAVCAHFRSLQLRPRAVPENWTLLDALVAGDSLLTLADKEDYRQTVRRFSDLDARERELSCKAYYPRLRRSLYPMLRTVSFHFYLHRRGMVKDTIHTTEPDTVYAVGVRELKDRNYLKALSLLAPYADWNTALAYCSLGRNASALAILQKLPPSAGVEYMKAIIHSRKGEDGEAVRCYKDACDMNPSYVHRGNLDPEIATLIHKYKLNRTI